MKFKHLLMVMTVVLTISNKAQSPSANVNKAGQTRCGTELPGEAWDKWFNQKVEEFVQARASGKIQSVGLTIPVIVHVIHGGQAVGVYPNLSQTQINSQIPVLNNDFGGTGLNVGNLAVTGFSAIGAANCNITFCLAEKDPNGISLAQPGIDRVNYVTNGWSNPTSFSSPNSFQNYMNGTVKPATIWDPSRYLNIWISDCSSAAGLLGYATFPPASNLTGIPGSMGTSTTDGVWVYSRAFGNTGTLDPTYNKGRTATHEIGHWVGLRHINGDANCATDYCNDTPVQQALNFGCPNYPKISCSNGPYGEMFMNFMDYSDDPCLYMFTPDQNTRIQTAMANSPYRKFLNASSATLCNVPAVAPVAAFTVISTNCRDSVVKPLNQTTGSPLPTYSWACSPSAGVTFIPGPTAANPSIIFAYPAIYTLSLTATNGAGSSSTLDYVMVIDCGDGVGIRENNGLSSQFLLAPNPGSGLFILNCNFRESQDLQIGVVNSMGQLVQNFSFNSVRRSELELHLEHLPVGIYSVFLDNGKEAVAKRIVISR